MIISSTDSYELIRSNNKIYPTVNFLIHINQNLISIAENPTTSPGVRYEAILEHLIEKLKYENHDSLDMITEIFFTIACNHPFLDGNKRTAYVSAVFLLLMNLEFKNIHLSNHNALTPQGKVIKALAQWGESYLSGIETNYDINLINIMKEYEEFKNIESPLNEEIVKKFIKLQMLITYSNTIQKLKNKKGIILKTVIDSNKEVIDYLEKT
jgi:death-on-curing family protein